MPDSVQTKFGVVEVPSVEELRQLGRERLMNYFLFAQVKPPDDLDQMAQAAHEMLVREAVEDTFDWEAAIKAGGTPIEDVARELGLDLDAESPDESAA
jgi:hypothetical protein